MNRYLLIPIFTFLLFSCGDENNSSTPPANSDSGLDFNAISEKLIERMDLQEGEKVLLVATPGRFDALIPLLKEKITAKGAIDLGAVSVTSEQPAGWGTAYTDSIPDLSGDELESYLSDIDMGVMLPGPQPVDPVYSAIQENLKLDLGRTIHFHWSGAYSIDNQLIESSGEIDAFYQNVLLTTDYNKLAADQKTFEEAMRGQKIRVTTPAGTDIEFEIGDRPVTKQDGDASATRAELAQNLIDREIELPAGAIRVAPIEETVNGSIAFPDMKWNGEFVSGLIMEFEKGKVVVVDADSNSTAVDLELAEAGEDAGRSFREFAIGLNPLLAIPATGEPWIPYYGYGSGIIRLSLGDNKELGGKVGGGYVRWNFFIDATVTVGDEVWVKDGKAVKSI